MQVGKLKVFINKISWAAFLNGLTKIVLMIKCFCFLPSGLERQVSFGGEEPSSGEDSPAGAGCQI